MNHYFSIPAREKRRVNTSEIWYYVQLYQLFVIPVPSGAQLTR